MFWCSFDCGVSRRSQFTYFVPQIQHQCMLCSKLRRMQDVEAEKFDPSSPAELDLSRHCWYQSQVIGKASSKALSHSAMTRNKPYWVRLSWTEENVEYSSTREVGWFGPYEDVQASVKKLLAQPLTKPFLHAPLPTISHHLGTCHQTRDAVPCTVFGYRLLPTFSVKTGLIGRHARLCSTPSFLLPRIA